MQKIYGLACLVYIWTGGHGPSLKYAYIALGVVFELELLMLSTDSKHDPSHFRKKWAVCREMRQMSMQDWEHVLKIASLPIWKRVWIQQETILSFARRMGVGVAGRFHSNLFFIVFGMRAIWTSHSPFGEPAMFDASEELPLAVRAAMAAQMVTLLCNCWLVDKDVFEEMLVTIVQMLEATNLKDYVYGMSAVVP